MEMNEIVMWSECLGEAREKSISGPMGVNEVIFSECWPIQSVFRAA